MSIFADESSTAMAPSEDKPSLEALEARINKIDELLAYVAQKADSVKEGERTKRLRVGLDRLTRSILTVAYVIVLIRGLYGSDTAVEFIVGAVLLAAAAFGLYWLIRWTISGFLSR